MTNQKNILTTEKHDKNSIVTDKSCKSGFQSNFKTEQLIPFNKKMHELSDYCSFTY